MKHAFQLDNQAIIDSYYSHYQHDKSSVSIEWQKFFDLFPFEEKKPSDFTINDLNAYRLIEAYREFGHLALSFEPLKEEKHPDALNLSEFGFSESNPDTPVPAFGLFEEKSVPLSRLLTKLKALYADRIGYEYIGSTTPEVEKFLKQEIEKNQKSLVVEKKALLEELCRSELFEAFLHTKYPGQKRFSLEGSETLIPILSHILEEASEAGGDTFVIGMAHRGRLNVLSNILKKSNSAIFEEFQEGFCPKDPTHSGDVKYHKGFSAKRFLNNGKEVAIFLTSNPSHLESVAPVAEGQTYAYQKRRSTQQVVPILIHGDAALSGQGVVYETLQLSRLEGYATGGTIHIVINNHIGFTTLPKEGRSTLYCTDIAKSFNAPVFHVSVEDPEACLRAAHLAITLRNRFQIDVFIDMNGYRKYGHNESDEPAFTQPLEYAAIRAKKSPRKHYEEALIKEGVIEESEVQKIEEAFKKDLQSQLESKIVATAYEPPETELPLPSKPENLSELAKKISRIPEGFTPHQKLKKLIEERLQMGLGQLPIDFGQAEALAIASLLNEGIAIRITGQDVRRGTFSHRHAVWCDQKKESLYCPFDQLGDFECFNSPLSEYACLGFEFGVSTVKRKALTIWEAQFGDFANGGQIVFDQYLSTSEDKWGITSNLTLLLPHGYEGQGPEHSSARVERFLDLSAKGNMIVANPTTAAQYFHLLRRQGHASSRKPLIIFTPKGLLRLTAAASPLTELEAGEFQTILADDTKDAKTVILCAGRIYYDLIERRKSEAIIRIEQLYPLDQERLTKMVAEHSYKRIIFAQEEPQNMGAWPHLEPKLKTLFPSITYIGRKESASPATGFPAVHKGELEALLLEIFY